MTIRLYEELFQSKGIIINEEKWNVCSVTREGFRLWEVKPVSGLPQLQVTVVPYLVITRPYKFIVRINNSLYDDGMELLVLVKIRTSMGWLLDSSIFPINSPKNMLKIPSLTEGICNGMPLSLCTGCHYEFSQNVSTIAWQTSRTTSNMVIAANLKPHWRLVNILPETRYRKVRADIRPGSNCALDGWMPCSCFRCSCNCRSDSLQDELE